MLISTPTAQSVSTRLSTDTIARLEEVANYRQCTRSDIVKEAVEGYLNSMKWLQEAVQQGLDDLKNGRTVSHEEVKESIKRLGFNVD